MLRRTPIRRVSKKRKQALTEYYRRRIRFLEEHPYCMVWIAENAWHKHPEEPGYYEFLEHNCPKSTEIHHTKKPKATYLNDESTWLAVCREMHDKIENNKAWAREKGYLQNI